MGEGVGAPVAAGLAIGIVFVVLFASFSPLTPTKDDSANDGIGLGMPNDIVFQPPDIDKAKVYIFPRNMNSNMTADDLDWELGITAGVTFAYGYGDGFGASKLGIYDFNGNIIVPNGTDFYISPDLKKSEGDSVNIEDIDDQHKFGNGIQVGDIPLKPRGIGQIAELVHAITFVAAESDIADVDAKLELIKDSISKPKLVKVTIPEGASLASSGKTYEPQVIKVIIGYNNTVRWVNKDSTPHFIEADNDTDLDFYRKTTYANPDANRRNLLELGDSFIYTFTNAGEIGYHGKPWMRGTVIVLENAQQIPEEGQQPSLEEAVEVIAVDFSPILAEQDIVVKKGQTVKVPIMIESGKETEKVLSLSIIARSDVPDYSELELSLDKESIVLSKEDVVQGKARDNGFGRLLRDAGFLTVSASPIAKAGTYEYGLEASYEGDGGDGMGAGQSFRVTVIG